GPAGRLTVPFHRQRAPHGYVDGVLPVPLHSPPGSRVPLGLVPLYPDSFEHRDHPGERDGDNDPQYPEERAPDQDRDHRQDRWDLQPAAEYPRRDQVVLDLVVDDDRRRHDDRLRHRLRQSEQGGQHRGDQRAYIRDRGQEESQRRQDRGVGDPQHRQQDEGVGGEDRTEYHLPHEIGAHQPRRLDQREIRPLLVPRWHLP